MRRSLAAAIAVGLWLLTFLLPWQSALADWPWLRAGLALLLFSVPGFCLHALLDEDRDLDLAVRAPAGLCLSTSVTGLLGFVGSFLGLPAWIIPAALFLVGAVGLAQLVRRGGFALPSLGALLRDRSLLVSSCVLAALVLLAARLCIAPVLGADDLTHVARVVAYQQRPALSFHGIAFGGDNVIAPRYWLTLWALAEAVLSSSSGIHPLPLTVNYLGPLLAIPATLAVYTLARSLGLSRGFALFAVAAQIGGLFLASGRDQPGRLFFNRITEDKFFAFFVLAPIVLQIVVAFLARPTRGSLLRVLLAWLAMMFSHSTSMGMTFLVVGAFTGLEVLLGAWRPALLVLAVIVPLTGSASLLRFVPHPDQDRVFFDVESASREKEVTEGRQRRISQIEGTRFYGIGPSAAGSTDKAIGLVVLAAALLRVHRERLVRYVAASLGVVAAAIFPYTGWLIGTLVTPFHLWRILCLVPFGIGAAYVAHLVVATSSGFAATRRVPRQRVQAVVLAAGTLVLVVAVALAYSTVAEDRAFAALRLKPSWQHALEMRTRVKRERWKISYDDLLALGATLQGAVGERAVVLGDNGLNDLVPSLTSRAVLLGFRSPAQTTQHAGTPLAEARRRWAVQARVVGGETTPAEAARFLRANHVDLVLTGERNRWLASIPPDLIGRTLVARIGELELYRIDRPAGAS